MWEELRRRGGEIAVVGLGTSGVAAARLLRERDLPVYASDAGSAPPVVDAAKRLEETGAVVEIGRHDLDRIARAALTVLSPGVPPEAPAVAAARGAGIEIWAEAELGLRALGGAIPYVAVTGTNGKTTTTTLVAHLLETGGRRALAAGNIGTPLSAVAAMRPKPEVLAVELSSFQLHDMPTVRPTVGVLTNLSPDHLDRYPTLDAYYSDKLRLFANATPASRWVINRDDPTSRRCLGPDGPAGRTERFSTAARADAWLDREAGRLMLDADPLLDRAALPLLGDHNVANALAAALAARAMGVAPPAIAAGLRTAHPLPHRMEPVREVAGVLWINDSKATNVASTAVAVLAMTRPFVLLLGGRHKGEPYTRLAAELRNRCRAVVAYGEAAPLVREDLGDAVPVVSAGPFDEVVRAAASRACPGDVVLLSPACSSYDMFTNYEERGRRFRALVESL
jgi:UDP-N-acetylmuramoylalanine--D-glutamate ligase